MNHNFKNLYRKKVDRMLAVMLRLYYTMRWVCVFVTGRENVIEREPNVIVIAYISSLFQCPF